MTVALNEPADVKARIAERLGFFRSTGPMEISVVLGEVDAGEEEALGVDVSEIDLLGRETCWSGRNGE